MIPRLDLDPTPLHTYVTTAEAADLLHVTPRSVRRWVYRDGLLPSGWHGDVPVYRWADVLRVWGSAHDRQRENLRRGREAS